MTCVSWIDTAARCQRALGFTVVELVVVILLLGVLSATAISRLSEPTAFAPRVIGGTLAAQTHFAALTAQTNPADTDLVILPSLGDWTVDVSIAGTSRRLAEAAIANTRIEVANGATTADVDAASALTLTFSGDGELVAGTLGATALDPGLGVEIRIIGDTTRTYCVHPTGYAGDGPC